MMLHSGLAVVLTFFSELIMEAAIHSLQREERKAFSSLNIFVHRADKNGRIDLETPHGVVFTHTELQHLDPYRKGIMNGVLEELTARRHGSTLVGPMSLYMQLEKSND